MPYYPSYPFLTASIVSFLVLLCFTFFFFFFLCVYKDCLVLCSLSTFTVSVLFYSCGHIHKKKKRHISWLPRYVCVCVYAYACVCTAVKRKKVPSEACSEVSVFSNHCHLAARHPLPPPLYTPTDTRAHPYIYIYIYIYLSARAL